MKIALIAHDKKKDDIIELAKKFREVVDTSDALNAQLRAVMGLGASV